MTVDRVAPWKCFLEMGFRYTDSIFFVQRVFSHCPLFAGDQLDLPWLQLLHDRSIPHLFCGCVVFMNRSTCTSILANASFAISSEDCPKRSSNELRLR